MPGSLRLASRTAALALCEGAAPLISRCIFSQAGFQDPTTTRKWSETWNMCSQDVVAADGDFQWHVQTTSTRTSKGANRYRHVGSGAYGLDVARRRRYVPQGAPLLSLACSAGMPDLSRAPERRCSAIPLPAARSTSLAARAPLRSPMTRPTAASGLTGLPEWFVAPVVEPLSG